MPLLAFISETAGTLCISLLGPPPRQTEDFLSSYTLSSFRFTTAPSVDESVTRVTAFWWCTHIIHYQSASPDGPVMYEAGVCQCPAVLTEPFITTASSSWEYSTETPSWGNEELWGTEWPGEGTCAGGGGVAREMGRMHILLLEWRRVFYSPPWLSLVVVPMNWFKYIKPGTLLDVEGSSHNTDSNRCYSNLSRGAWVA